MKVVPGSREAGHGRGGTDDGLIPSHGDGDNTPLKGAALNWIEKAGHSTPHNDVGSSDSDDCALYVQASNVLFAIDDYKHPK